MKIVTTSPTGKSLNRILCILLMNQQLGLSRAHLPGRENQVADKTLHLSKDNLTRMNYLLHVFLFQLLIVANTYC